MRAKLTTAEGLRWHEWIVVSRWGIRGHFLSIARTFVPVSRGRTAPIRLIPRETALAARLGLPPASAPPTFLLTRRLPSRITLAGDFAPADGYVRLHGSGMPSTLVAEGRCVRFGTPSALRIEAVRIAWIGEFVEGMPSPDA